MQNQLLKSAKRKVEQAIKRLQMVEEQQVTVENLHAAIRNMLICFRKRFKKNF